MNDALEPGGDDAVHVLVERYLDTPEPDRDTELQRLCAEHPDRAGDLRTRIRLLRDAGMLDESGENERPPAPIAAMPEAFGEFRLLETLGRGGMGVVYLAEQPSMNRRVALKLIRSDFGLSGRARERFRREVEAVAGLDHPGICTVYEAGEVEGVPFIAMRYIDGETLADRLARESADAQSTTSRQAVLEHVERIEKVARALHHAHEQGLVHRDVKPGNIMIGADGGPVLLDFGLARPEESTGDSLTATGDAIGTPAYMSPEQIAPRGRTVDRRTDVYSLAATLYECVARRLPFAAQSKFELSREIVETDPPDPSRLNRQVPSDLGVVLATALEKSRDRRYRTAGEFADELARVCNFEPIRARRAGPLRRLQRWTQRHPMRAALLGVLITATAAVSWLLALAEDRLDAFDNLSAVELLRAAKQHERGLYPPWPEKAAAIRDWLTREAEPLIARLPRIRAVVAELRGRSQPLDAAKRERAYRHHAEWPELAEARRKLAALRAAKAVRAGAEAPPIPDLGDLSTIDALGLITIATSLAPTGEPREWGHAAHGLALARLGSAKVAAGDPTASPETARRILCLALHANGLDEEARNVAREAGGGDLLSELEDAIAAAPQRLADQERRVAQLEESMAGFGFDDEAQLFLHDSLAELADDLEEFAAPGGLVERAQQRLTWASRVREISIERHRNAWSRARESIAKADGESASKLYSRHPIDLAPQVGLVPIGMNPRTGLWEFYHLHSAWDPAADDAPADLPIPTHDADGTIAMSREVGVVFVLVPGGTFTMGAQSGDESAPNYDRAASRAETPHRVRLDPYFIARHELTQAQWARMTGGDNPSQLPAGQFGVTWWNPVTRVSHDDCTALLGQFGLALPTEAQWEYACRAGTTTPWWTGREPRSLQGAANLADATAKRVTALPEFEDSIDDGFVRHAPADAVWPNPWGLHHMHGNVTEWCRDFHAVYLHPARSGDGLRQASNPNLAVVRGGDFMRPAKYCRSAQRGRSAPSSTQGPFGLRAARPVVPAR